MKRNVLTIILVIILIGVIFSGCFEKEEDNAEPGAVPLAGWLFELDNGQIFFVTTSPTYNVGKLLTDQEVEQIIGSENILPITTQINLTDEETNDIVLDYLIEINCSESIEIGEIELIEYRSRNPYQVYVPIYKLNETIKENYGIVTVSVSGKYVAIPSLYCIQGEQAFDFTIPDNSSSKEVLINYMLNNNIQNNITNEYYMMYYANNLEFMRSVLGEEQ